MEAVKFLEEKERMCTTESCIHCPAYDTELGIGYCKLSQEPVPKTILRFEVTFEEAVAIVEKWSAEHPIKTRLQDFLEKYPNAVLDDDGIPKLKPSDLGYCGNRHEEPLCRGCKYLAKVFQRNTLELCWNLPLEE